jgi:hypothetical protein
LILVICAAIGFSFGAYPRFWDQVLGRKDNQTIVFLTSDQQNLPPSLVQDFFADTGYDLQIQEVKTPNLFLVEAKNASVLYAPWEWLEASKDHLQTWPDSLWSQLYADFQSSDFFAQKFFPLFWTLQADSDNKKYFHFEGFATFNADNEGAKTFVGFLLRHPKLLKAWTQQKKMGATLQKASEWKDLSNELKPQSVRENPLAEISTKPETTETTLPKKNKK